MRTTFPNRSNDPWAELARMQRELARLTSPWDAAPRSRVYPPANFYQSEDHFLLRFEMPGVDPASLDITTRRDELAITGERRPPEVEGDASYHRRERRFGTFRRTFTLPDAIDGERVEATYRDGILDIRIPRPEEAKPRQIQVITE